MVQTIKTPLISVIVASYNYGRYLQDNLDALKKQTYKNIEIIIIDDGSTDDSLTVIQKYIEVDSRFKLITHKNNENCGLNESLKKAIKYCNGEYIGFCESDDYWTLNHIEEFVKYINNNPSADVIVCDLEPFGKDLESIDNYKNSIGFLNLYKNLRNIKTPQILYFKTYRDSWVFPTFSIVMLKKDVLKKCSLDAPTKCGADIWLWYQVMIMYKTGYIDKKLTYYRRHGESFVTCTQEQAEEYDLKLKYLISECIKNAPMTFDKLKYEFRFFRKNLYKKIFG